MEERRILVREEDEGKRIDAFLSEIWEDLTRSAVQALCGNGNVLIGEAPVKKNYRVRRGDVVSAWIPPPLEYEAAAQNIPLDVVYEDEELLVVNKPKGMVVHPAPGNPEGTLVNALLHHCGDSLSGVGGVLRPGIVHRIDKDTSGLLVAAKNDRAHQSLSEQIQEHSVLREYRAVAYGRVREDFGVIDASIGRHPVDRKRMCVTDRHSKRAVTHFRVEERYRDFTYLALRLETGRTHQIRVHLAYRGHPVAGDPVYGPKKVIGSLGGQCLHAKTLGFRHPGTGSFMEFTSPLPEYFLRFLRGLAP